MKEHHAQLAVVGAGHAGIEAALAAARMGLDTVLFTLNLDAVANMPCNPSIGGTAKGHLVYEIDALGGEMGRAADLVTLQSRTLNLGKGAAVRSKRVQADRIAYRAIMKHTLERQKNLRLIQAEIVDLTVSDGRVSALYTRLGERWDVGCAIIAAGTYLEGMIHVGDVHYDGGPDGMQPAKGLTAALAREGIALRRFKTGTPPRINRRSIDFARLERQDGEEDPVPYSSDTPADYLAGIEQTPCYTVYTTPETHALIRENIGRSAMYSGKIRGTGPRYCPSIEDKIVRFADKSRHQLFAEPCGSDTEEIYLQGFSTSMPADLQIEMVRSLPGFEHAEIMRYAYAIEYDCADPTQLLPTLEFKSVRGLYGAGQFNGTSGYEEAAAQGLVAGINAALSLLGREPMILSRDSSYIGTLIDDLVTKGTNEPYRMMTSRSEYRLLLRQDNADVRLSPIGYRVGLLSEERYRRFLAKRETVENEKARLASVILPPSEFRADLGRRAALGTAPASRTDLPRPRPARSRPPRARSRRHDDGADRDQVRRVHQARDRRGGTLLETREQTASARPRLLHRPGPSARGGGETQPHQAPERRAGVADQRRQPRGYQRSFDFSLFAASAYGTDRKTNG